MKLSKEDRAKANNVKGLFKDSGTRRVIVVTGVILVGFIAMGVMKIGRTADEEVGSSASLQKGPSVQHQPGVNDSPAHSKLQQEENARKLEAARQQGASSLPRLTSNTDVAQPIILPSNQPPASQTTDVAPVIQFKPVEAPVQQAIQQPNVAVAQAEAPKREAPKELVGRVEAYLQYWAPKDLAFQEYTVVTGQKQWAPGKEETADQMQSQSQASQAYASSSQTKNGIRFVRAGTMIPAKLITPLNSDAPGPVLAEITSGPLAGARLIGAFSTGTDSLTIRFNSITKPGWPSSYNVSAVAMNGSKSTALATDVNKHYLAKYVGLLGGAFLQGYGDGMTQQGQVSYIQNGTIVSQTNELSSSQILKGAKGEVVGKIGEKWERSTRGKNVTVKVEGKDGAEYPIQILFLNNF